MYAQFYRLHLCGACPIMYWMHFSNKVTRLFQNNLTYMCVCNYYVLMALCRESDSLLSSPESLKGKVSWCLNNFLVVQGQDLPWPGGYANFYYWLERIKWQRKYRQDFYAKTKSQWVNMHLHRSTRSWWWITKCSNQLISNCQTQICLVTKKKRGIICTNS